MENIEFGLMDSFDDSFIATGGDFKYNGMCYISLMVTI
jgi:hypothetical protein